MIKLGRLWPWNRRCFQSLGHNAARGLPKARRPWGGICEQLVLLLANTLQHLSAGPSQLLDSDGWQKSSGHSVIHWLQGSRWCGQIEQKHKQPLNVKTTAFRANTSQQKPAFLQLPHKHTGDLKAEECGLFLNRFTNHWSENTRSRSHTDAGILHV